MILDMILEHVLGLMPVVFKFDFFLKNQILCKEYDIYVYMV